MSRDLYADFFVPGFKENNQKTLRPIRSLVYLHILSPLLESVLTVTDETPQTWETGPSLHKAYQQGLTNNGALHV